MKTPFGANRKNLDMGLLAEAWVAQWLVERHWTILHRRWRCRWGELDLVAQGGDLESPLLVFVEVKARSVGNWDADGLLAITPQKRAKLWRAAELFLAEYPGLAGLPCRFDVALVRCRWRGLECDLSLQDYIAGAFD